ncbi:MAG: SRPBCC family protein [Fimbriimonadaceae bacterium]
MSNSKLVANASLTIDAPRAKVWEALISPEAIREYMFGSVVTTDWREGSPITWKGKWEGEDHDDKGTILQARPELSLQYTHFSNLSGLRDEKDNYHTITIELSGEGDHTWIAVAQDNICSVHSREDCERVWMQILIALKMYIER